MRPSIDETMLAVAAMLARRSTCLRRAVGCVLCDARGRILSTGYNGVAAGLPHCNELDMRIGKYDLYPHACPGAGAASGTQLDACHAVHAEANAIVFCREPDRIQTAYVTTSPCIPCAKLLINTGCRSIIFSVEYTDASARELWLQAGREWLHHKGG